MLTVVLILLSLIVGSSGLMKLAPNPRREQVKNLFETSGVPTLAVPLVGIFEVLLTFGYWVDQFIDSAKNNFPEAALGGTIGLMALALGLHVLHDDKGSDMLPAIVVALLAIIGLFLI